MLEYLKINLENREKKAFYASDYGKSNLDLYFGFTGEPQSNPASWYETLKWGAGRGVEDQMLRILKDSGIVAEEYNQKEHGRIELERHGIRVHGYIDALSKKGNPLEIKSINNKNAFDLNKYERGYPRESYVGQLATYMEQLNSDQGALFASSIDGLNYFWIPCERVRPGVYRCGNVEIDIDKEYQRWAKLYTENIVPRVLPDIWQYRYKHDVNTLDWTKQSKNSITKARNGHAVIGDWQISWSPWKNKIIELQGTVPGYTAEEMQVIMEKTKGYTTPEWKEKQGSNVDESATE